MPPIPTPTSGSPPAPTTIAKVEPHLACVFNIICSPEEPPPPPPELGLVPPPSPPPPYISNLIGVVAPVTPGILYVYDPATVKDTIVGPVAPTP
jgi:hypothetical protein